MPRGAARIRVRGAPKALCHVTVMRCLYKKQDQLSWEGVPQFSWGRWFFALVWLAASFPRLICGKIISTVTT